MQKVEKEQKFGKELLALAVPMGLQNLLVALTGAVAVVCCWHSIGGKMTKKR